MKKRGQLNISFGMIFSIILVIVFLAAGFYAIAKFIDMQKEIQIRSFVSDLQEDVDTLWKNMQGSQSKEYVLPTKITAVCFVSGEKTYNMEFISENIFPREIIGNIDIGKITEEESPFCIENVEGKINLIISKKFGETLVTITK
jgi:hypothetical protein